MQCPQCKGYRLEPVQLENGLIAAGCSKCGGALLSLLNYRFWSQNHQTDSDEKVSLDTMSEVAEGEEKAQVCPKCARLMTKFKIGLASANKLDLCTHCDEAWLDKGEWRLLKQLELHGKLPQIFTDAWQREIRKERMQNLIKQRYVEMVGAEDFEKIDAFKSWLNDHPNREEIKQYLVTSYE